MRPARPGEDRIVQRSSHPSNKDEGSLEGYSHEDGMLLCHSRRICHRSSLGHHGLKAWRQPVLPIVPLQLHKRQWHGDCHNQKFSVVLISKVPSLLVYSVPTLLRLATSSEMDTVRVKIDQRTLRKVLALHIGNYHFSESLTYPSSGWVALCRATLNLAICRLANSFIIRYQGTYPSLRPCPSYLFGWPLFTNFNFSLQFIQHRAFDHFHISSTYKSFIWWYTCHPFAAILGVKNLQMFIPML